MTVRVAIASEFAKHLTQRNSRALEKTMIRMDELGCWRKCISQFAVGRQDASLGAALLSFWTTYGFRIAKGLRSEITVLVDALRHTLPEYAGPSMTLYRGELAERYSARSLGIAWTPDQDVAVMFADRRLPDEGQGAVLRIEASIEMIVAAPTDHSKSIQEKEYIVDPRMITTIEVLRAINDSVYSSTTAQMNAENRKFWEREAGRLEEQLREHPHEVTSAAGLAEKLIKAGHTTTPEFATETSINAYSRKLQEARSKTEQRRRATGTANSIKVRQSNNIDRDRRIHDAKAGGKNAKTIAANEGKDISTINRILGKPRP